MITRLLLSAVVAGILAGLAVAALQAVTTTPLIIAAEAYEGGAPADHHAATAANPLLVLVHSGGDAQAGHDEAEAWGPADGFERTFFTSVATVGSTVGFALVLLGLMLLARVPVTARAGALWGAAAFAATGLATALGLAPELPGSAAAALADRQVWWIGTAVATGAALWLAFRVSTPAALAAAAVLAVLPHLVGAPHPETLTSTVPAELAGHFAAASLAVQAIGWVAAGALAGLVWERLGRTAGAARPAAA